MEILSPSSSLSNSRWILSSTKWTAAENKAFEDALALYDKDTPDRWEKVAKMVPGKTVSDVIRQYKDLEDDVTSIEAGLMDIPAPVFAPSPFTLDWGGGGPGFEPHRHPYAPGKRPLSGNRLPEQERKKGVPWSEEEHRLFLLGLKKYGKGDWRNISRNFVITRTPTQVASHAQKYFIRQLSGGKDKRRASIHDITTINLNDNQIASPDNKKSVDSPDQQPTHEANSGMPKMPFEWSNNGAVMGGLGGSFFVSPYGVGSYEMMMMNKMQDHSNQMYFGQQHQFHHHHHQFHHV